MKSLKDELRQVTLNFAYLKLIQLDLENGNTRRSYTRNVIKNL